MHGWPSGARVSRHPAAGSQQGVGGRCLDRALRAAREGIEVEEVEAREMCGESVRVYREERTKLQEALEAGGRGMDGGRGA